MVKPTNTDAITKATQRPWDEWTELLENAGAREMRHASIAKLALELMPETVSQKEWWAQSTAIAFEQHAGLRVPGQSSDGDFQVSASRTVQGSKDEALQAWLNVVDAHSEFGGVPVVGQAEISQTDKWRYWRVRLADDTRVAVTIGDKPGGKATVGLQHSKLESADAINHWRPIWKELLRQL